jgi:outer membrane receptor for monomeric catechols
MKIKHMFVLSALVVAVGVSSSAEDQAALGLRYATAQQAGIDQLKLYTWQTDTKLTRAGEIKVQFAIANRLNEKGEMVQDVESAETSVKNKRGLRGRSQDKQVATKSEFLDKVVSVMASYIFMTKGQEVDYFDKATITEGVGADVGKNVVQAANVSVAGDLVTKWVDPDSLFPSKLTFDATIDGVAVNGEVLFRPIENGPNVPRMATVQIPGNDEVLTTEFLEYKKQL